MRSGASWLHTGLRSIFLGGLLAAAWLIFGMASAHAAPLTGSQPDSGNAREAAPPAGPAGTLLEPAASLVEPAAPSVSPVIDAAFVPLDAVASPVTGQLVEPVAGPVAGTLSPVTFAVSSITDPVVDVVSSPVVDVLLDAVAPVSLAVVPLLDNAVMTINDAPEAASFPSPFAVDGAVEASAANPTTRESVLPVSIVAAEQNAIVSPSSPPSVRGLPAQMSAPGPVPGLPVEPGPLSPATPPAGSGSTLRAGSDTGSAFSDLAAFELPFTRSSLAEVRRRSEELPGSVSLDHGFSPD